LRLGHAELRKKSNAPGHTFVFSRVLIAEENRARIASTNQFPGYRIQQVLVLGKQLRTAQLTALYCLPFSGKSPQCCKCAFFLRDK
jgi:hypothetical protein